VLVIAVRILTLLQALAPFRFAENDKSISVQPSLT